VSGSNGITANFAVSFTVTEAPTYGISLDPMGPYPFPKAPAGYGALADKSVTVTNPGTQATGALSVVLSGANGGSFTLIPTTSIASIAAGSSGTFTVVPKTGLSTGVYTATVTVSGGNGISASFDVSFSVASALSVSEVSAYLTAADGGSSNGTPVPLPMGDFNLNGPSPNNWEGLLTAIGLSGKFVALNLSGCTMFGTVFDPISSLNPNSGKGRIASLILPNTATSIQAGTNYVSTFVGFNQLMNIEGAGIQTIGSYAFGSTVLRTASFPAATFIDGYAFANLNPLNSIPFHFTITLGATAPTLGIDIFHGAYVSTITVKRPSSAAAGYGSAPTNTTDNIWGNGFRYGGWNGSAMLSGGMTRSTDLYLEDL
jgi:hypothetical protein